MKLNRRTFMAGTAATTLAGLGGPAFAQDKVVKIGMPMDFTRVYTFVTSEYAQGHRDYLTLVNDAGGAGGYKIVADITDHGNDIPRAIEAYERMKRDVNETRLESQALLVPVTCKVSAAEAEAAEEFAAELERLGVGLVRRGPTEVQVTAVPALLAGCDVAALVREVLADFASAGGNRIDEARNEVLATLACHAAIRANRRPASLICLPSA